MSEQKSVRRLSQVDIQIGITILLCLVLCYVANHFGVRIEALAVTTGAIMCVQDNTKAAYQTSLIRILGVLYGGVIGVVVVLIDNAIGNLVVFYLLCAVGVVVNMLICKYLNMTFIQARVSAMTMLLVALTFEGTDRLGYALSRFVGSLVGALIALLVTFVFVKIFRNRRNTTAS